MTQPSPWPHRAAWILSSFTLVLIFIGGLVTSTHSGLTVPDWPLSYGRLMPPMIGGIFFEHGHRMAATGVGVLTILLNLVFWRWEDRPWVKRAGGVALGLVILQGVFGGLTVLFKLPKPVSIAHACLGQTFFCWTVALVVWTSPAWRAAPVAPREPEGKVPLPHVALLLFLTLYLQLVLGAVLRHTGQAAGGHVLNALFVLLCLGWIWRRLTIYYVSETRLWRLAQGLGGALAAQWVLGVLTLIALTTGDWTGATIKPVALATLHVMGGALMLGLSLAFWMLTGRGLPLTSGRLKDYLTLTKPGISGMSAVTALAGYVLGSRGSFQGGPLFHATVGTLFVAGGACALNMLAEKDVDARMHRTVNRPLPARRLGSGEALFLGGLLSLGGVGYLAWAVNGLTAAIAGLTLAIYLWVYTPMKKTSALNTFFGAIAGALPPVVGWVAATGRWDAGAWVLFALLFFWQYPHFFALAWLYKEDYARGGLAMLPVVEANGENTARQIVMMTFGLISVSLLPSLMGWAGSVYFAVAFFFGLGFLALAFVFFKGHTVPQARRLFLASVLYLPLLLGVLVWDWKYGGPL